MGASQSTGLECCAARPPARGSEPGCLPQRPPHTRAPREPQLSVTATLSWHAAIERVSNRAGRLSVSGRYHRPPRLVEDDYEINPLDVLGTGFSGNVIKGRDKETGSPYAFKKIQLGRLKDQLRIETEAEVFLGMDHPHIARLVGVYERFDTLMLVMECMEGGEVFDRLHQKQRFSESDASHTVWQMLLAVNYLHSHNVVHRDLKLENFLYEKPNSEHIKLIDFGFSRVFDPDEKLGVSCGTLGYMAPEVLNKCYTQQCDLWSLGVAAFILLLGYMPFNGPPVVQMRFIRDGQWAKKPERWNSISPVAKDFLKRLLYVDPAKRLTADQALQHEFILGRPAARDTDRAPFVDVSIPAALAEFARSTLFRRVCMSMMAWSLNSAELANLRDAFVAIDADNDGAIKLNDLRRAFTQQAFTDKDEGLDTHIRMIIDALDVANQEEIHYTEFIAAMVSTRMSVRDGLMKRTFNRFDVERSGFITVENLRSVLGESGFGGAAVEDLASEADADRDGKISYEDFVTSLQSHQKTDDGNASSQLQCCTRSDQRKLLS